MSLVGKVMFNQRDEVLFVDWEQFNDKEKIPTGLDPIMTLLENVYYELLRSNNMNLKFCTCKQIMGVERS